MAAAADSVLVSSPFPWAYSRCTNSPSIIRLPHQRPVTPTYIRHEVAGAIVHDSLTDVLPVEHSHSPLTVGSGPANPCWAGCGAGHEMGVGSCLLALTLLMLSWLLAPSRDVAKRCP